MLTLALSVAGVVVGATAANAAPIPGAVTNVTVTTEGTVYNGSSVQVNTTWSVPNSAAAGDTFSLTLPDQFLWYTSSFDLVDQNGDVVATAVGNGTQVIFTLTDYVDTHDNVAGTAHFDAYLDAEEIPTAGPQTLIFTNGAGTQFSQTINVEIGTAAAEFPGKGGGWLDVDVQDRIAWTVRAQVPATGTVVLVDTLQAGHVMDCPTIQPWFGTGLNAGGGPVGMVSAPPARYAVTCSPTGFTITFNNVTASEVAGAWYQTVVSDPTVQSLRNDIESTANGEMRRTNGSVEHVGGGGEGDGDNISITKWITADGEVDGAFDDAPGKEVPASVAVPVTMTITNTGSNPLTDVEVTDATLSGPDLTGLTCDFSALGGPATGTTWAGPFAAGASFPCTGTIPAMAPDTAHGNEATVTATGNGEVTDTNPLHVHTPPRVIPAAVTVGDYVWVDTDKDGIQDAGEPGIEDVTLTLTGPDGNPVTDVDGNPVGPVQTDADGLYLFPNLPVLPAGEHYTVTIDTDSPALAPYVPTTPGVGGDRAVDSSTGSAESTDLTTDGAEDLTLDFGFIVPSVIPSVPPTEVPPLASTGGHAPGYLAGFGLLALVAGAAALLASRRRSHHRSDDAARTWG